MRSPSRQRPELRTPRSLPLAFVAVLCLVLQAGAIAHSDFAAHGVCEHGELTDLTDGGSQSPGITFTRPGRAGLFATASSPEATFHDTDEHCVLSQMLRNLRPGAVVAILAPTGVAPVAAVRVPTQVIASRRPLDVSPKQSPPA